MPLKCLLRLPAFLGVRILPVQCSVLSALSPCGLSIPTLLQGSAMGSTLHLMLHFREEGVDRTGLKQALLLYRMYGVYDTLWHLRGLLVNRFIPILRVGDDYAKHGLSAFS